MASFDDLGRALRDDAEANAPRASAIDLDAVMHAARARRRPRQWAVGTLSVVAVLGLGGIAVAGMTPPALIAASESADLEAGTAEGGAAPLADDGVERAAVADLAELVSCGAAVATPDAQATGLVLDVKVATFAVPRDGVVDARAVLTNTGTTTIDIVTGTSAVAVLTQNGVVVSVELPRDSATLEFALEPGESRELPAFTSTVDCRDDDRGALAAGDYDVFAVLDVLDPASRSWTLVIAPTAGVRLD